MALPTRLRSQLLGERALRFELAATPVTLARAASALVAADPSLDAAAGSSAIVVVAPAPIDPLRRAAITTSLAAAVATAAASRGASERTHAIDVVYDGPDLGEIAAAAGMSPADVAARHAEVEYVVELGGFLPGFAYLGEVPARLRRPRRSQPRPRVAAGSVGIAGRQTGIYPSASPGGWNLVGRAVLDAPLFDPAADPPSRLVVGDRVTLRPVAAADAPAATDPSRIVEPTVDDGALSGALVVDRAPFASIQDAGRSRWLFAGVPASGAMDPVALAAANLAVGNDPTTAGLEIASSARFVARRTLLVSIDGETAVQLQAGEAIDVPRSPRLVSYLAVRGGIDVPPVLGTRSTALAASLGGFRGRMLRRGDVLAIGDDPGTRISERRLVLVPGVTAETVLRIDVIPPSGALDAASVAALLEAKLTVSSDLDRVGVRLRGTIPRHEDPDAKPEPVVPGAVQIARDGTPMVLGPDAAVTGGYPVIGVLRKTSLWALYRLRPGAVVRFARGAVG